MLDRSHPLYCTGIYHYTYMLDRIAVGSIILSCFILGTMYKSNLMAMLIKPRIVRPFDSLASLLDTDIPMIVSSGSYLHSVWKVGVLLYLYVTELKLRYFACFALSTSV